MRRLAYPKTQLQASSLIQKEQTSFSGGLCVDNPSSEQNIDELSGLENTIGFSSFLEGRKGCRKMSDLQLPTVLGRSITGVSKNANKVMSDDLLLQDFTLGRYLVWPDGYNDQITDFDISDKSFTSRKTIDSSVSGLICSIRDRVFSAAWNKKLKLFVIHIGDKLYYTDNDFSSWNEIVRISNINGKIGHSFSKMSEDGDMMVVFNSEGIYRIAWDSNGGYYYQINGGQPRMKINSVEKNSSSDYGRRVIYTLSRIDGDSRGDRITTGNVLKHETAPVLKLQSDQEDTADVYSDTQIGLGNETYGYVQSSSAVSTTLSDYDYSDATLNIGMNGLGTYTVLANLSSPKSMQDIANRFQTALKGIFKDATFEFKLISGSPFFVLTTGYVNGSTIDSVEVIPLIGNSMKLKFKFLDTDIDNSATYSAPINYTGFTLPLNSNQYTHVSLYGSKDIGDKGILAGYNPDYLVWLMDVPRAIALKTSYDSTTFEMSYSGMFDAKFKRYFESCRIKGYSSASVGYVADILSFNSKEKITDTILIDSGIVSSFTDQPACFGASKCSIASQIGNTVTLDSSSYSKFEDNEYEVGCNIFWEDGSTSYITKWVDDTTVIVRDFTSRSSQAIAWDLNDALLTISDYISDKVIDNRRSLAFYILQTRLFMELPSSFLGELTQSFLLVCEENSSNIKYSENSGVNKTKVGYYYAGAQEDNGILDVVTYIKKYPSKIIVFCKKSTWWTSINSATAISDTRIGRYNPTLSRFQLLDAVGVIHTGSIQDVDLGTSIIITHDGSVSVFNGEQFSGSNVADGKVVTYLEEIDHRVCSSYDSKGGYLLYATTLEQKDNYNRINNQDGICLRLAIKDSQGSAWTRYSGDSMVWPEPLIGGIQIEDDRDYNRQIAIDEITGKIFEISPYKLPNNNDTIEDLYYDKDNTPINCSVLFPQRIGAAESMELQFMESHCYLRYLSGESGFLANTVLSALIYKNDDQIPIAETDDIKQEGDIVFDRPAKAKRLQIELRLSNSGFRIIKVDEYYNAVDKANYTTVDQKRTLPQQFQADLNKSILRLTRGKIPTLQRTLGNKAVVVGNGISIVDAPFGLTGAMQFDEDTELLTNTSGNANADYFLSFSIKIQP